MGRPSCLVLLCLFALIASTVVQGKPRKSQGADDGGADEQPGQGQRPTQNQGKRPRPEEMICGSRTTNQLLDDLNEALMNATEWLLSQRTANWGWPLRNTASAIAFLQLADESWFGSDDLTAKLSVKQLHIELLSHLLMMHRMPPPETDYSDMNSSYSSYSLPPDDMMGLISTDGETMPGGSGMLAYYIMALKSTCQDPTDFYGVDFIEMLQEQMDMFPMGDINNHFEFALGILVLCQCDVELNPKYVEHIIQGGVNALMVEPDMASMVLMAMSCIKDEVPSDYEQHFSQVMRRLANYLYGNQNGGGKIGRSAISTAFAAQALMAAEVSPSKWNCVAAVRAVLDAQSSDGGFESLGGTLRILPMLSHKSLANLKDLMPRCDRPQDNGGMEDSNGMWGGMGG